MHNYKIQTQQTEIIEALAWSFYKWWQRLRDLSMHFLYPVVQFMHRYPLSLKYIFMSILVVNHYDHHSTNGGSVFRDLLMHFLHFVIQFMHRYSQSFLFFLSFTKCLSGRCSNLHKCTFFSFWRSLMKMQVTAGRFLNTNCWRISLLCNLISF